MPTTSEPRVPRPAMAPTAATTAATTILVVRHAEVDNPKQVLYGRLPRFGLSYRGRQQAERVANFLADRPIAAIYSSPLLRARQTAATIARYHPTTVPRVSSLLQEVRSAWQGTPFSAFKPGFNTYGDRREPDDESIEDIRGRMVKFVERVRRRSAGACVACVSHGDPITILRVALSGRPLTLAAIRGTDYADLCSVTEITFQPGDERPRIAYLPVPCTTDVPIAAGSSVEGGPLCPVKLQ